MAYDSELSARLEVALKNQPVVQKKMFGGVAFLLNGNMLVGVHGNNLIARVGPVNYEACLLRPHTKPFDMTGRPMSGWVEVMPEGLENDHTVSEWTSLCLEYNKVLPPK
jgi:hypothetical protein